MSDGVGADLTFPNVYNDAVSLQSFVNKIQFPETFFMSVCLEFGKLQGFPSRDLRSFTVVTNEKATCQSMTEFRNVFSRGLRFFSEKTSALEVLVISRI